MRSPIYLLQVYEEYLYFLGKEEVTKPPGCDSTCIGDPHCGCTHKDGRECPGHVCDLEEWICWCT